MPRYSVFTSLCEHLIADSGADAVKAGEDVSRHRGSVCTMHRYVICRFFVRHDFLPGRIVTPAASACFLRISFNICRNILFRPGNESSKNASLTLNCDVPFSSCSLQPFRLKAVLTAFIIHTDFPQTPRGILGLENARSAFSHVGRRLAKGHFKTRSAERNRRGQAADPSARYDDLFHFMVHHDTAFSIYLSFINY